MKMISMTKATLCVLGLGMGMAAFAADDLPKGLIRFLTRSTATCRSRSR